MKHNMCRLKKGHQITKTAHHIIRNTRHIMIQALHTMKHAHSLMETILMKVM